MTNHNAVTDFVEHRDSSDVVRAIGYQGKCYTEGCGWRGDVHHFSWDDKRSVRRAEDEAWEDAEAHEDEKKGS